MGETIVSNSKKSWISSFDLMNIHRSRIPLQDGTGIQLQHFFEFWQFRKEKMGGRYRRLFHLQFLEQIDIILLQPIPLEFESLRSDEHTSELQSRGHLV